MATTPTPTFNNEIYTDPESYTLYYNKNSYSETHTDPKRHCVENGYDNHLIRFKIPHGYRMCLYPDKKSHIKSEGFCYNKSGDVTDQNNIGKTTRFRFLKNCNHIRWAFDEECNEAEYCRECHSGGETQACHRGSGPTPPEGNCAPIVDTPINRKDYMICPPEKKDTMKNNKTDVCNNYENWKIVGKDKCHAFCADTNNNVSCENEVIMKFCNDELTQKSTLPADHICNSPKFKKHLAEYCIKSENNDNKTFTYLDNNLACKKYCETDSDCKPAIKNICGNSSKIRNSLAFCRKALSTSDMKGEMDSELTAFCKEPSSKDETLCQCLNKISDTEKCASMCNTPFIYFPKNSICSGVSMDVLKKEEEKKQTELTNSGNGALADVLNSGTGNNKNSSDSKDEKTDDDDDSSFNWKLWLGVGVAVVCLICVILVMFGGGAAILMMKKK